jgi:predicted permease
MSVLLLILREVMAPLFLLAGIGVFLQRRYRFDMGTLSKILNVYLLPAVCFVKLYDSRIDVSLAGAVIGFWLLLNGALTLLSRAIVHGLRVAPEDRAVVGNGMVLSNQGNYGLPVSELVFAAHPVGMSMQVIISVLQNVYTYTFGVLQMRTEKGERPALSMLRAISRMPVLYALLAALACRVLGIRIPAVLWEPTVDVAEAFLAIALLTLGAQLADFQWRSLGRSLVIGTMGRLFAAPAMALLLIFAFRWEGAAAQALFMASAYPVSRNSALLALEYDRNPQLAAQLVAVSTVCSCLTVTAVIYAAQLIW